MCFLVGPGVESDSFLVGVVLCPVTNPVSDFHAQDLERSPGVGVGGVAVHWAFLMAPLVCDLHCILFILFVYFFRDSAH